MLGRWAVWASPLLGRRDAPLENVGTLHSLRLIKVTDDDQGWDLDLDQPAHGGRFERQFVSQPGRFAPQRDQVHLPDEVPRAWPHPIRVAVRFVYPDPILQLGDSLEIPGLISRDQLFPLLRGLAFSLEAADRGGDQNQGATRPGFWSAKSTIVLPPIEQPTRNVLSMPREPSRARRSSWGA